MAEFLSSAWIAALDAAARSSCELAAVAHDGALVVEQRVSGTPEGDVCYHIVVDPAGARVAAGPAPRPDLVLRSDLATAVALHRGETNAQRALVSGGLTIAGDVVSVARRARVLDVLDDVFCEVRAGTTLPRNIDAVDR